jgi:hypothetical protein
MTAESIVSTWRNCCCGRWAGGGFVWHVHQQGPARAPGGDARRSQGVCEHLPWPLQSFSVASDCLPICLRRLTKWVPPPVKMTRSYVEENINRSRKRMDVAALDMLQFHWYVCVACWSVIVTFCYHFVNISSSLVGGYEGEVSLQILETALCW